MKATVTAPSTTELYAALTSGEPLTPDQRALSAALLAELQRYRDHASAKTQTMRGAKTARKATLVQGAAKEIHSKLAALHHCFHTLQVREHIRVNAKLFDLEVVVKDCKQHVRASLPETSSNKY